MSARTQINLKGNILKPKIKTAGNMKGKKRGPYKPRAVTECREDKLVTTITAEVEVWRERCFEIPKE